MVSFLSVMTVLRRFMSIAEAASLPRERAYLANITPHPLCLSYAPARSLLLSGSVGAFYVTPLRLETSNVVGAYGY